MRVVVFAIAKSYGIPSVSRRTQVRRLPADPDDLRDLARTRGAHVDAAHRQQPLGTSSKSDAEPRGITGGASVLRVARVLRVLRTARMARLVRLMPELMILIKGMMVACRSVFFTLVLLLLFTYVFSVPRTP